MVSVHPLTATTSLLHPFMDSSLTHLGTPPSALCSELGCVEEQNQAASLSHATDGLTGQADISQTMTPVEQTGSPRSCVPLRSILFSFLSLALSVIWLPAAHPSVWDRLCLSFQNPPHLQ